MTAGRYLAFSALLECFYLAGSLLQIIVLFIYDWKLPDGTLAEEWCEAESGAGCSFARIELPIFAITYIIVFNLIPTFLILRVKVVHASIFGEGTFHGVSNMMNSRLIKVLGVATALMSVRMIVFVLLALSLFLRLSVLGALSVLDARQFTGPFIVEQELISTSDTSPTTAPGIEEEQGAQQLLAVLSWILFAPILWFLLYTTRSLVHIQRSIQKQFVNDHFVDGLSANS